MSEQTGRLLELDTSDPLQLEAFVYQLADIMDVIAKMATPDNYDSSTDRNENLLRSS